jgi:hypothetical protein
VSHTSAIIFLTPRRQPHYFDSYRAAVDQHPTAAFSHHVATLAELRGLYRLITDRGGYVVLLMVPSGTRQESIMKLGTEVPRARVQHPPCGDYLDVFLDELYEWAKGAPQRAANPSPDMRRLRAKLLRRPDWPPLPRALRLAGASPSSTFRGVPSINQASRAQITDLAAADAAWAISFCRRQPGGTLSPSPQERRPLGR